MSLRPEPPTETKNPSFSYIPDEITVNCLARLSRNHYTRLSLVSKTFRSLLSSKELYGTRAHLGNTENCFYVCLCDIKTQFSQWFTLWINPNQTLPNSSETKKIGKLLVPITSPNVPWINDYTSTKVVVGSEIYVVGGRMDGPPSSSVKILDCRSHTWRDGPSMNVARIHARSCFSDRKIYVVGGCQGLEAEVFDTKTRTWERLPNPGIEIPLPYHFRIAEIGGKICIHHSMDHINKLYAYDPKQDKWECTVINGPEVPGDFECAVENVWYRSGIYEGGKCMLRWYDLKDGNWKEVRGLDSVSDMISDMMRGKFFNVARKLVSFGGKLLLTSEGSMNQNDMKEIWCAQIMVEKRDGGEVWGNVEWVNVVQTVPRSCGLVQCLAVSL